MTLRTRGGMTGTLRAVACVCGGRIVADPAAPGPAVLAHGRSPRHEAWRLGLRLEDVTRRFPAADGGPVQVHREAS